MQLLTDNRLAKPAVLQGLSKDNKGKLCYMQSLASNDNFLRENF